MWSMVTKPAHVKAPANSSNRWWCWHLIWELHLYLFLRYHGISTLSAYLGHSETYPYPNKLNNRCPTQGVLRVTLSGSAVFSWPTCKSKDVPMFFVQAYSVSAALGMSLVYGVWFAHCESCCTRWKSLAKSLAASL